VAGQGAATPRQDTISVSDSRHFLKHAKPSVIISFESGQGAATPRHAAISVNGLWSFIFSSCP